MNRKGCSVKNCLNNCLQTNYWVPSVKGVIIYCWHHFGLALGFTIFVMYELRLPQYATVLLETALSLKLLQKHYLICTTRHARGNGCNIRWNMNREEAFCSYTQIYNESVGVARRELTQNNDGQQNARKQATMCRHAMCFIMSVSASARPSRRS